MAVFRSAWPLAVGVTIGDILWPLVAIFRADLDRQPVFASDGGAALGGRDHLHRRHGVLLIRHAGNSIISSEGRLARPGLWPAFSAGVAAVIGNPKAILFYMGVLPGFFDLTKVTVPDIAAILLLSASIPLMGNLFTAFAVGQAVNRFPMVGSMPKARKDRCNIGHITLVRSKNRAAHP